MDISVAQGRVRRDRTRAVRWGFEAENPIADNLGGFLYKSSPSFIHIPYPSILLPINQSSW